MTESVSLDFSGGFGKGVGVGEKKLGNLINQTTFECREVNDNDSDDKSTRSETRIVEHYLPFNIFLSLIQVTCVDQLFFFRKIIWWLVAISKGVSICIYTYIVLPNKVNVIINVL